MKTILITGTEETDKDVIIDLTLKGTNKILPKFDYLCFTDFKIKKSVEESQRTFVKKIMEKIKKTKSKKPRNLIINCNFIEKNKEYYIPTVTENFFDEVKPDFIILMKAVKKHLDEDWQRITESYIISNLKKEIKIIKVEEGNIKKAIKSLRETLKSIMV
jgi:adenylate kinase